jgi:predicted secreted protein
VSVPNEADFALIKIGDGATPTEAFTTVCGIENVSINETANTSDRTRRDCAKPGKPAVRRVRTSSTQVDISGSGGVDKANVATLRTALGISKNYKVELYQRDGSDAGVLYGTYAGPFVLTSTGISLDTNGDGNGDMNLASDGVTTWTPAS